MDDGAEGVEGKVADVFGKDEEGERDREGDVGESGLRRGGAKCESVSNGEKEEGEEEANSRQRKSRGRT